MGIPFRINLWNPKTVLILSVNCAYHADNDWFNLPPKSIFFGGGGLSWLHNSAEAPTPTKNKGKLNVIKADWSQITVGLHSSTVQWIKSEQKSCGVFLGCLTEGRSSNRWEVGWDESSKMFVSLWRQQEGGDAIQGRSERRSDDSAGLLSAAELRTFSKEQWWTDARNRRCCVCVVCPCELLWDVCVQKTAPSVCWLLPQVGQPLDCFFSSSNQAQQKCVICKCNEDKGVTGGTQSRGGTGKDLGHSLVVLLYWQIRDDGW